MTTCEQLGGGRKKKTRRTRKLRGGVQYGAVGPIAAGAMQWGAVNTSEPYSSVTGEAVLDPFGSQPTNAMVGGRRRKARKTRKTRKGRKGKKSRKMRGGASSYNAGGVGAAFVGSIPGFRTGSQTYGAYQGYPVNVPAGNPYVIGKDGITQV